MLSGDIGAQGDDSDNSFHVVVAAGVDNSAVLEGFLITGGNADGEAPNNGGGGLTNTDGSAAPGHPALRNVAFEGNSADVGGGMFLAAAAGEVVLEDAEFKENEALRGGGLYSTADIDGEGVEFEENAAAQRGGPARRSSAAVQPAGTSGSCSGCWVAEARRSRFVRQVSRSGRRGRTRRPSAHGLAAQAYSEHSRSAGAASRRSRAPKSFYSARNLMRFPLAALVLCSAASGCAGPSAVDPCAEAYAGTQIDGAYETAAVGSLPGSSASGGQVFGWVAEGYSDALVRGAHVYIDSAMVGTSTDSSAPSVSRSRSAATDWRCRTSGSTCSTFRLR